MKKVFIFVASVMVSLSLHAQVSVSEPEFVNSYCILTSEQSYDVLPKESGRVGEHKNKAKTWTKVLRGVAGVARAGGAIGIATAGSVTGVVNGMRVAETAGGVADAAGAVGFLAGASGMDVIFNGGHSPYKIDDNGQDVYLLVKSESNEADPMDFYRIVRFNISKKERRIQWVEYQASVIGSSEAKKAGFVRFSGHKYGEQSYLLSIPASEIEKGEYGIFYVNAAASNSISVATFSVL